MTHRVEVRPQMFEWARARARLDVGDLARRFPRLLDWEAGRAMPTFRQLESYAAATHAPLGFFLLPEPPAEEVPIPDFRTMRGRQVTAPSANLLDTIYLCEARQDWYRDYARAAREDPLAFVGSVRVGADVVATAATIGTTIGFDLDARRRAHTWEDALRTFIQQAEGAGVLVMRSGIVGNNTHRPLDPDEFRGFALADPLAPVVFVNGADTKSGQMFTLAHELVHIWCGQTALSDEDPRFLDVTDTEAWCNAVAAELLVPQASMREAFEGALPLADETRRLARRFKVSTLVILRRVFDIGGLSRNDFWRACEAELERLRAIGDQGAGGGNFHFTEAARVSRRFAQALVSSTLEGQTLYRDAFRMLGISKMETFRDFGQTLGVAV